MYVSQLYAGHWYISAFTSAPDRVKRAVLRAPSFEVREDAEAEMARIKKELASYGDLP